MRFRGKVHKSVLDDNIVEVSEVDGVRSLHLGSNTVQSSMKLRDTFSLELAYTRGMMCFLLFSETYFLTYPYHIQQACFIHEINLSLHCFFCHKFAILFYNWYIYFI